MIVYNSICLYMCDVHRHAIAEVIHEHIITYRTCHMHIMHSHDDDDLKRVK